MLAAHLQDMTMWTRPMFGGGKGIKTGRESLGRAAKRPLPKLQPHPPLKNPLCLPISQLEGMQMAVADSSVSEADLGLFSLQQVDTDVLLCSYTGKKLLDTSSITEESPRYDYVWSNTCLLYTSDAADE